MIDKPVTWVWGLLGLLGVLAVIVLGTVEYEIVVYVVREGSILACNALPMPCFWFFVAGGVLVLGGTVIAVVGVAVLFYQEVLADGGLDRMFAKFRRLGRRGGQR